MENFLNINQRGGTSIRDLRVILNGFAPVKILHDDDDELFLWYGSPTKDV